MSTPAASAPARPNTNKSSQSPKPLCCDVERGPNWLIVRLHPPKAGAGKATPGDKSWADQLEAICEQHFTYRLVVEMDDVTALSVEASEQLALLSERLAERGGSLKLCGLRAKCKQRFDAAHAELHDHANRRDALMSSDSHQAICRTH